MLKSMGGSTRHNRCPGSAGQGSAVGASTCGKMAMREHSFGVASLPSDNIDQLMHNDFQRQYLNDKMAKDDAMLQHK